MGSPRVYGMGRLLAPDERDQAFPLKAMLVRKPKRRTKPWDRPRVLDQGGSGTCVGHAWRLWLEMAPHLHPADYGLSAFDIYRHAVLLDEFGGVSGLVTLDDVLTEVMGEVGDELKGDEPGPERLPDGRVLLCRNDRDEWELPGGRPEPQCPVGVALRPGLSRGPESVR